MTNQGLNKGDNEFIDKVINAINDNISDPNFNVEQLADILLTSRSSLNRRIKAVTNMSPLWFIRSVRMQKAASLIQEGKFRVNEISYLVGITTPSYFIKLFQEQYGMTPKEYEIQCRS
jgi:AraC-like DNA-binding protein